MPLDPRLVARVRSQMIQRTVQPPASVGDSILRANTERFPAVAESTGMPGTQAQNPRSYGTSGSYAESLLDKIGRTLNTIQDRPEYKVAMATNPLMPFASQVAEGITGLPVGERQFQEEHPFLSMAGQAGGYFVPAGALGKIVRPMLGTRLLGRLAAPAIEMGTTNVAQEALGQAVGTREPSNLALLKSGAEGAGMGLAFGGMGSATEPLLAKVANPMIRGAAQLATGAGTMTAVGAGGRAITPGEKVLDPRAMTYDAMLGALFALPQGAQLLTRRLQTRGIRPEQIQSGEARQVVVEEVQKLVQKLAQELKLLPQNAESLQGFNVTPEGTAIPRERPIERMSMPENLRDTGTSDVSLARERLQPNYKPPQYTFDEQGVALNGKGNPFYAPSEKIAENLISKLEVENAAFDFVPQPIEGKNGFNIVRIEKPEHRTLAPFRRQFSEAQSTAPASVRPDVVGMAKGGVEGDYKDAIGGKYSPRAGQLLNERMPSGYIGNGGREIKDVISHNPDKSYRVRDVNGDVFDVEQYSSNSWVETKETGTRRHLEKLTSDLNSPQGKEQREAFQSDKEYRDRILNAMQIVGIETKDLESRFPFTAGMAGREPEPVSDAYKLPPAEPPITPAKPIAGKARVIHRGEGYVTRDATPEGFGVSEGGREVKAKLQRLKGESVDAAMAREVGYQIDNGRVKLTPEREGWKATIVGPRDEGRPHIIGAHSKEQVISETWKYLHPDYVEHSSAPTQPIAPRGSIVLENWASSKKVKLATPKIGPKATLTPSETATINRLPAAKRAATAKAVLDKKGKEFISPSDVLPKGKTDFENNNGGRSVYSVKGNPDGTEVIAPTRAAYIRAGGDPKKNTTTWLSPNEKVRLVKRNADGTAVISRNEEAAPSPVTTVPEKGEIAIRFNEADLAKNLPSVKFRVSQRGGHTHIFPKLRGGVSGGYKWTPEEESAIKAEIERQGLTVSKKAVNDDYTERTLGEGGGFRVYGSRKIQLTRGEKITESPASTNKLTLKPETSTNTDTGWTRLTLFKTEAAAKARLAQLNMPSQELRVTPIKPVAGNTFAIEKRAKGASEQSSAKQTVSTDVENVTPKGKQGKGLSEQIASAENLSKEAKRVVDNIFETKKWSLGKTVGWLANSERSAKEAVDHITLIGGKASYTKDVQTNKWRVVADNPQQKGKSQSYLNEQINYGGEMRSRGSVIAEMQKQGTPQKQIDAYMIGTKAAKSNLQAGRIDVAEANAKARIRKRGGKIGSNLIIEDMADYAIIVAAKMARGTIDIAKLTAEMVKDFGEDIRQHMQAIYDRAQKMRSGGNEGFYKKSVDVILTKVPLKAPADVIEKTLLNNGVKPEEIKWELSDLLNQAKAEKRGVTRKELLEHIDQNQQTKIEDITRSEAGQKPRFELKQAEDAVNESAGSVIRFLQGAGVEQVDAMNAPNWIRENNTAKLKSLYGRLDVDDLKTFADLSTDYRKKEIEWDRANQEVRRTGESPKFSSYKSLPGGEDYRELLITLPDLNTKPSSMHWSTKDGVYFSITGDMTGDKVSPDGLRARLGDEKAQSILDKSRSGIRSGDLKYQGALSNTYDYTSSHWGDVINPVAHVRFDERTDAQGKKVLFVHEFQSDWAREGREKEFGVKQYQLPDLWTVKEKSPGLWNVRDEDGVIVSSANDRDVAIRTAIDKHPNLVASLASVADAPFVRKWQELAAKKVLQYASKEGYDRVAWATGEQVAKTYDLRKQVDEIQWRKEGDNSLEFEANKSGNKVAGDYIGIDALDKNLGKSVGEKIRTEIAAGKSKGLIAGKDLAIGGEWATNLYDREMPQIFNQIGKRFGLKSGKIEIGGDRYTTKQLNDGRVDVLDNHGRIVTTSKSLADANELIAEFHAEEGKRSDQVNAIDVSPELRQSVKTEGLSLYSGLPLPEIMKTVSPAARATAEWFRNEFSVRTLKGKTTPPEQIHPVEQKFIKSLPEAKDLRKEQEAIYRKERSRRFGAVAGIGEANSGEAGHFMQKSAMSGEMQKVEFESIRKHFGQDDIDYLFQKVWNTSKFTLGDKLTAREGLEKLLGAKGGVVPTRGEISLLSEVFPHEMIQSMLDKRPLMERLSANVWGSLGIMRALMATGDFSFPLRQGIFLAPSHPLIFGKMLARQFQHWASPKLAQERFAQMQKDPLYLQMREDKLDLMDSPGKHEEPFMSQLPRRIPVFRHAFMASDRAYAGAATELRFSAYKVLRDLAKETGYLFDTTDAKVEVDPSRGSFRKYTVRKADGSLLSNTDGKARHFLLKSDAEKVASGDLGKEIAAYVNMASGRGALPKKLAGAADALNATLFAPKLVASRLRILSPTTYINASPFVRQQALKDLMLFGGAATTAATIALMAGAQVEWDSRSSDFMKIKIGNTRYDFMGGFGQYLVLVSRMTTNSMKSSTTGKVTEFGSHYGAPSRWDMLQNFATNKTAPALSFGINAMRGKNPAGEPFNISAEITNRFYPMVAGDLADIAKDKGWEYAPMIVPGMFGMGVQTYEPYAPKQRGTSGLKQLKQLKQLKTLKREQ